MKKLYTIGCWCLHFRPMIQRKLDVLGKAGLTKDNFSNAETTRLKVQSGQQIRSKIDSFQNANFLNSQPNPMMLPLIGIVSERRFQWWSHHMVWLRNEKVSMKTALFTFPCPDNGSPWAGKTDLWTPWYALGVYTWDMCSLWPWHHHRRWQRPCRRGLPWWSRSAWTVLGTAQNTAGCPQGGIWHRSLQTSSLLYPANREKSKIAIV